MSFTCPNCNEEVALNNSMIHSLRCTQHLVSETQRTTPSRDEVIDLTLPTPSAPPVTATAVPEALPVQAVPVNTQNSYQSSLPRPPPSQPPTFNRARSTSTTRTSSYVLRVEYG